MRARRTNHEQAGTAERNDGRWNFAVMGLDLTFFVLALSFVSPTGIMPLFVQHLSSSNLAIGLIPAVRALGIYFPPILIAHYTERLPRKLPFLLRVTVAERVPFLLVGIAVLLLARADPLPLLIFFFVMMATQSAAGGLGMPAWLDTIARMIPSDRKGRFFGRWSALGGLMGIGGGAIASYLLREYRWPYNFAACFGICFLMLIISFVWLALGREPANTAPTQEHRSMLDSLQQLPVILRRDRNFSLYLLANALTTLAGTAVAFFTVSVARDLHLSDSASGLYTVVLVAATTAGNLGWGMLGDRIGHKRVLEGGIVCMILATGLAFSGPNIWEYVIVFLLAGLSTSAIQLAALTFVIEFGPPELRPTYIGLGTFSTAPSGCLGPIIAGWLADLSGYGTVFGIATLCGIAALGLLVWGVVDPRTHRLALGTNISAQETHAS